MRVMAGLSVLFFGASCVFAQNAGTAEPKNSQDIQTAYCPQTHQLEAEPSQKFFLDGMIGKRHVRMYLDRGGSGVVGLFFDIGGTWETTLLGGTWNNGQIDASDATELHVATGHLTASLAKNRLTGTWTASNSNQSEPVELITIPEPSCDGKGTWRRFEDPDWPVTFAYPASWHLEQSEGDSITVTCPNPSEIAFDRHITVYHGAGVPAGPTNLVQCGKSWIYGYQCRCDQQDSQGCSVAKVSRLNAATILDVSEREHRIYCLDGGYVAAGEGEDRIILLRDQWLEIDSPVNTSEMVNRIVGSIISRKKEQQSRR